MCEVWLRDVRSGMCIAGVCCVCDGHRWIDVVDETVHVAVLPGVA